MSSNEATDKRITRRKALKIGTMAVGTVMGGGILAACGDAPTATRSATTAASTTSAATTSAATTAAATSAAATTAASATTAATGATTAAAATGNVLKSPLAGVPDAYLAPPPVFKSSTGVPGKGTTVRVFGVSNQPAPPPRAENQFWQELEKRLGVTWEFNGVPSTSYAEKAAVTAASGDFPDLFWMFFDLAPDQYKLIQQGAFTDLTPYLSGDGLKEFPNLAAYPPQLWKNVAIGGKIYGVPRPRFLTTNSVLVRKDWADKFGGLESLKNAEDVFKLLTSFTKNDPNGNSQADTWGWGFRGGSFGDLTLPAYFSGMFRVPNQWKQNGDGSLSYFIEAPEYKEMLSYLRRLYEAGVVYPDSLTQSDQQMKDNFVGGKYGFMNDSVTGLPGAAGRRATAKKIDAKADVVMVAPPGFDGGKGVHHLGSGYLGFTAIPSKVGRDKERVKELLGVLNYIASPFGSEEFNFISYGIDGVHNEVKPDGSRVLNDKGTKERSELTTCIGNAPLTLYYPGFADQPALVQGAIKSLVEIGIDNPALTAQSATFNSKGKELQQFLNDRVQRIVVGRDPVSELDNVIKDWKSRGGDLIAKEYAASIKA
jgi:putative aldouronate transport system substrate-binding protein